MCANKYKENGMWNTELMLWPLVKCGLGRDKVVERRRPGPNLKVTFRHLPGVSEENTLENT